MITNHAKYTVVLKSLMDNPQTKQLLEQAMSTYPLYVKKSKEEYIPSYIPTREELNKKILNAYKYREIGFETVGRFLDELEIRLNEIMPKYNLLYFSADQDFNIIFNVDYVKTLDRKREDTSKNDVSGSNTGSTDSTSESNNKNTSSGSNTVSGTDHVEVNNTTATDNKKVHTDTPQDELEIIKSDIDSVSYADSVEWDRNTSSNDSVTNGSNSATSENTSNSTNEGSATSKTTSEGSNTLNENGERTEDENIIETIKGNFGVVSAQDLVAKYRETIINIDQMIINDDRISSLFMRVY